MVMDAENNPVTATEITERLAMKKTPREIVTEEVRSLRWVLRFEDLIVDYCRRRSPSGEVLWNKIREWLSGEAGEKEPRAVAWSDLAPARRAALDLLALQYNALAPVLDRHFPTAVEPAFVIEMGPRKFEGTIYEQHKPLSETDPYRVEAVAAASRILASAHREAPADEALSIDDVGEDEGEEESEEEEGEGDDEGGHSQIRGASGTVIIGEMASLGIDPGVDMGDGSACGPGPDGADFDPDVPDPDPTVAEVDAAIDAKEAGAEEPVAPAPGRGRKLPA